MLYARRLAVVLAFALLPLLAYAPPAAARKGKPVKLKMPRIEVPPRSDLEVCTFVRLPMKQEFDNAETLIVNIGGNAEFTSHHFLMWQYLGKDMDQFPKKGTVSRGEACIDFGPTDSNQRALIAGSQSPRALYTLPRGLAQRLTPTVDRDGKSVVGLIMNTHWINSSDKPQRASVRIKMRPTKGSDVKRFIKPIFEVVGNAFIDVPPGQVKQTGFVWGPGGFDFGGGFSGGTLPRGPACVAMVTAHMHKRGKEFTVFFRRGAGEQNQDPEPLYRTTDYSDPGQLIFDGKEGRPKPLLINVGESLAYYCMHDNGVTTDVKLGCEEVPGEPPGLSLFEVFQQGRLADGVDHAAKRCTSNADCPATDPAYPDRTFTGQCVPANLVFGFTSDDDMCILPGAYYDPNPAAPPGQECDLDLVQPGSGT
jgi:hypothetical protein